MPQVSGPKRDTTLGCTPPNPCPLVPPTPAPSAQTARIKLSEYEYLTSSEFVLLQFNFTNIRRWYKTSKAAANGSFIVRVKAKLGPWLPAPHPCSAPSTFAFREHAAPPPHTHSPKSSVARRQPVASHVALPRNHPSLPRWTFPC